MNPYTGLAYKDDPVFVLTEITNECDLFRNNKGVEAAAYYVDEFRALYKAWLEKSGLEDDWQNITIHISNENVNRFKLELTRKNTSITSSPYCFPNLAKLDVAGKPFFISEWDMPWPNSYRAEGPIYYASVGALQGWSGFTIHTYAYSTRLDKMDVLGRRGK